MSWVSLVTLLNFYALLECQTYTGYLWAYFNGNSGNGEAVRFAISDNGFEYVALNNNNPILSSATISSTGGVRDPHIYRGVDGKSYYMVMTDMVSANGYDTNPGIVMLKSTNLIDWTYSRVTIRTAFSEFSNVSRMWAPETIYDSSKGKYMVYFSLRLGNSGGDVLYYSYANNDFTALETAPQFFFPSDKHFVIDADIINKDGRYYLFHKTSSSDGEGIKVAVSSNLTSGYVVENDRYIQPSTDASEGPCVFKLIDSNTYVMIYQLYKKGSYQFSESTDLLNFKVTTRRTSYNFTPWHGTIMTITEAEKTALKKKWG